MDNNLYPPNNDGNQPLYDNNPYQPQDNGYQQNPYPPQNNGYPQDPYAPQDNGYQQSLYAPPQNYGYPSAGFRRSGVAIGGMVCGIIAIIFGALCVACYISLFAAAGSEAWDEYYYSSF